MNHNGFSDSPMTEDHLGMGTHCIGIADFVRGCSTPMTVAIQGDWGAGKSTAMNLIEKHIREKEGDEACIIPFNTWQFSALGSEDKLIVDLLSVMLERFETWINANSHAENENTVEPIKASSRILGCMKSMMEFSLRTTKKTIDDSYFGKAMAAIGQTAEAHGPERTAVLPPERPVSKAEIVSGLKENIEQLIQEIVKRKEKGNRVYVFIDDLDRLEPRIAVELMEGLKNFADYRSCVFILAVDQEVVERGLRSKYGDDFQSEKARNFFDKIIQVPFVLPVKSYDLTNYVRQFIPSTANPVHYVELLSAFGEHNPRTIKRSFNVLQLNECIRAAGSKNKELTEAERLGLYAVHLLQLRSPRDFEQLLLTVEQFKTEATGGNHQPLLKALQELCTADDSDMSVTHAQYIHAVVSVFFPLEEGEVTAKQIGELIRCVNQTCESAAIDNVRLNAIRQLRSLRRLYARLQNEQTYRFSEEWALLEGGVGQLFGDSGKPLQLTVFCGKAKYLMLSWYNAAQRLNMTVYHFDDPENVFAGIGQHFARRDALGEQSAEYQYYRAGSPERLTVAAFSDYQEGDPLDQLLINCGILHAQE